MPHNTNPTSSIIMPGNRNHGKKVAGKVNRDTNLVTNPKQKGRTRENMEATSHFTLERWQTHSQFLFATSNSDKGGLCVFQSQAGLDLGYSNSEVFLLWTELFGRINSTVVGAGSACGDNVLERTPKPQNMPSKNNNISRWPKDWGNSISTSPSTSKHKNTVPEGMEDAFAECSRGSERTGKAALEKFPQWQVNWDIFH